MASLRHERVKGGDINISTHVHHAQCMQSQTMWWWPTSRVCLIYQGWEGPELEYLRLCSMHCAYTHADINGQL